MLRQRSGMILNLSSIASKRALPGSAVYTATKAAVDGLQPGPGRGDAPPRGAGGGARAGGGGHADLGQHGGLPPREKMLRAEDVARAALLMATLPPNASLEELTLLPAEGIL